LMTSTQRRRRAEVGESGSMSEEGPREPFPEVAFVGRSNGGKSTVINRRAQKEGLARVSSTPGRTRRLNFFDLELQAGGCKHSIRFCDLPGYGFAKVSKLERMQWAKMIETYLRER